MSLCRSAAAHGSVVGVESRVVADNECGGGEGALDLLLLLYLVSFLLLFSLFFLATGRYVAGSRSELSMGREMVIAFSRIVSSIGVFDEDTPGGGVGVDMLERVRRSRRWCYRGRRMKGRII